MTTKQTILNDRTLSRDTSSLSTRGRRLNRQAQIIGHVFIFVLGAFVMVSVLLIGYRAITNLQEQQCRAQEAEFARDVRVAFESGLSRGRVRTHTFGLPCGATEVCFVARSFLDSGTPGSGLKENRYAIIKNSVETRDAASVWLLTSGGYTKVDSLTESLPIANFNSADGDEDLRCYTGGSVSLRFEGRGMSVFVTEE